MYNFVLLILYLFANLCYVFKTIKNRILKEHINYDNPIRSVSPNYLSIENIRVTNPKKYYNRNLWQDHSNECTNAEYKGEVKIIKYE